MIRKYVLVIVALVVLIIAGGWMYITRQPSAPSEPALVGTSLSEETGDSSLVADDVIEGDVYQMDPTQSLAAFNIDEVLRGEDFTVVGETREIGGELLLTGDLEDVQFGLVRVNARTLKTDNTNRDGAIARAILKSENPANEFIQFKTTAVFPRENENEDSEEVAMDIVGDLTVAGVTRDVTFDGLLSMASESTITGHAETVVQYKDFDITIPQVPFVASVSDDVFLSLDFVAQKVE